MASVNPLGSPAGTNSTSASAAASASGKLADTYDSFLKLLTTQLKHQNPLEPMDSNQFISQLVEFAGVEQQIASNTNLEKLIALQSSGITTNSLGYIGKTVEAAGDTNSLANSQARFAYTLPANAANTTVAVVDAQGNVIYTTSGQTTAGHYDFTWNGTDSGGNAMPDGQYRIRVVAIDSDGKAITTSTSVIGKVTAIEQSADGPVLSLGGARVPIANIIAIKETTI